MQTVLPFPALVGIELAQQALLLLAVDPGLRGVALAAAAGSGKSTLARGYRALAADAPFVELPLGSDDDALLGGLDLEATLRQRRRVARPGILARANGGALYIDQLNLLGDGAANLVLAAMETRTVALEREGLSLRLPASFVTIASYDVAEGMPRRHLLDRFGLHVMLPRQSAAAERATVIDRHWSPIDDWHAALALLCDGVAAARAALPQLALTARQLERLAEAAVAFGVEGQRVDLFAARAARAAAALALRDQVTDDDLRLAVRLVIAPRATRQPEAPAEAAPPPPPPPPEAPADDHAADAAAADASAPPPDEQVLTALGAELPEALTGLPFATVRRGRTGSRGATLGARGRHIRSLAGDPRRARIDIGATLRAAAPWQPLRRAAGGTSDRVMLRGTDLRVRQFRTRAGALFLFVVDASGSMALNRMRQAKGAVQALLQRAYVHRDRVALLAFRGDRAEVLLPPSQSVELAQRALDILPTGGGTPLAAALLGVLDVARQARARGILQTVAVLLTDGRANVPLRAPREALEQEVAALAQAVAQAGIRTVVVDTQRAYLSAGHAARLARALGGTYVYLPNAHASAIADAATAAR
ncbi:MAG: magnesium chelatase ATPase subunit D [Chloroflexi bacterium]|nr:magnesium chelatase ATPase subunit D [Chloroflexota bacterium]